MELEFSGQIFEKSSNTKYYANVPENEGKKVGTTCVM